MKRRAVLRSKLRTPVCVERKVTVVSTLQPSSSDYFKPADPIPNSQESIL